MESPPANSRTRQRALVAAALAVVAVIVAGCGASYVPAEADRANGKNLFVHGANGKASCGSCHTLADAGTTGTLGPNLDDAFRQALLDGETEATVRQVVRDQIAYSIESTSTGAPGMPKNLVTGEDADDVAAYVATAVAKGAAAGSATPSPTPAPPPAPSTGGTQSGGKSAQLAAGKTVFLGAGGCGACHTLTDAGSSGNVGPKLDTLAADAKTAGMTLEAYIRESIENPNAYVVPGFPKGVMPPDLKKTLTPQQLNDLVAYLNSVTRK